MYTLEQMLEVPSYHDQRVQMCECLYSMGSMCEAWSISPISIAIWLLSDASSRATGVSGGVSTGSGSSSGERAVLRRPWRRGVPRHKAPSSLRMKPSRKVGIMVHGTARIAAVSHCNRRAGRRLVSRPLGVPRYNSAGCPICSTISIKIVVVIPTT